jgi:hypothetical protein
MTVVIGQAKTDVRDKVWKVIRGLISFTYDDVITLTGIPDYAVSTYLRKLYHAGYIRRAGRRTETDGKLRAVWRLAKNTGPKAPMPCQCLYDPNIDDAAVIKDNAPQPDGVPPLKLRGGKGELPEAGHVD